MATVAVDLAFFVLLIIYFLLKSSETTSAEIKKPKYPNK
jgi:hypothetical protein